ncbi:4Fe-4S dicluster domain-containing protein [Maritimibacter sp. DP07]|jgi:ferredoxin-type protein NapF|uniref:Ferredoxin-type protein NapF n=1 Tax=Maritimibacter harenae TaxID=2606218 RepID=A0A845LUU1_9RHOB|nr:ferredoxin-type protein NapF [Maritimibacter harenae]MZR11585.1 4Fe-4S dicluster domain-containing protein [Maritimibacter harenae]
MAAQDSTAVSRRAFLGGHDPTDVMPWTTSEIMREACTGCGACVEACPEGILHQGRGGHPVLDFSSPCTFCAACAEACPEPVFDLERDPPWTAVAVVASGCLEPQGIACRACEDACDHDALRARPMLGGRAEMRVDADACTGCGGCVPVCPTGAIQIREQEPADA